MAHSKRTQIVLRTLRRSARWQSLNIVSLSSNSFIFRSVLLRRENTMSYTTSDATIIFIKRCRWIAGFVVLGILSFRWWQCMGSTSKQIYVLGAVHNFCNGVTTWKRGGKLLEFSCYVVFRIPKNSVTLVMLGVSINLNLKRAWAPFSG